MEYILIYIFKLIFQILLVLLIGFLIIKIFVYLIEKFENRKNYIKQKLYYIWDNSFFLRLIFITPFLAIEYIVIYFIFPDNFMKIKIIDMTFGDFFRIIIGVILFISMTVWHIYVAINHKELRKNNL